MCLTDHKRRKSVQYEPDYGEGESLNTTFRRVEREGKTVAWNVFFRGMSQIVTITCRPSGPGRRCLAPILATGTARGSSTSRHVEGEPFF